MNRADYNVGNLESEIKVQFEQAVSALNQTTTALDGVVSLLKDTNSQLNNLKNNTGLKDLQKQSMGFGNAFKSTIKFGAIYGVLRKGFNTVKDITSANIDMIETTNLFEVQMGKVVDEYGNLDEAQSQYYTKAMAFQDKMNEKLATNKSEMQKYQAMYYGMLNSQLGSSNRDASYLMSESLTKAGYDIASLYNLDVETAMNKLKSGLAGQIESLRQIGIDVSEASLAKVLDEVGIDRSVQQLSYAEKEVARYIAIVEQAGKAQGDFARTFEQPANQIRVFKNQMIELKQVAGSFFVGLFGQIMPVINGIIMAIKEILKALGSVFGFEVDIGSSSLGAVSDTVGDIGSGLGSTTKKAKEFKKQLMGFDEINNITPPSENSGGSGGGGTVSGIDSALLNALKEWDNKMDSISGKAQEIRDKILDWLGVTDGSYENLKKILEIAKLVGVAIGTWKIASTVSNFFKNWGKLSKSQAFQLATGITLTITGLVAQFNGTKQLISGNWSLFNLIETALGTAGGALGIVSIMKALKLGTKLNFGQKLAIGFGIMFEMQGLQVAYTAMEDLSKGAIDANKAFTELTIGIGETIGAGASLGAQFGGLKGALVGGLLGALAGGVSALIGYKDETVLVGKELEENTKKTNEYIESIEKEREAIQEKVDKGLAEQEYYKKLAKELENLVDSNGKVKKGYEDRVNFILNQLNSAYGTEYKIVDGQIQKYDELKNNIYKTIEAEKAKIVLEANQEAYTNAIKRQIENQKTLRIEIEEQNKAQQTYSDKLKEIEEKYGSLEEARKKMAQPTGESWFVTKDIEDLDNLNKKVEESKNTVNSLKEKISKDNQVIVYWEDLKTATIEGNEQKIQEAMQNLTSSYSSETDNQEQSLIDQLNAEISLSNDRKKIYEQEGIEINDTRRQQLDTGISIIADKLVEQTKTVETLTPDQINAWKTLAEGSENVYNEKISQIDEDTRLLLDMINNKIDTNSPEFIKKWQTMSSESKTKFNQAIESLPEDAKGKVLAEIMAVDGLTESNRKTYENLSDKGKQAFNQAMSSMDKDARNKVQSAINEINGQSGNSYNAGYNVGDEARKGANDGRESNGGSKQIGNWFVQGLLNALTGGQYSIWKAGYDLVKQAIFGGNKAQQTGSPAKETIKMGNYFTEGYIIGLKKKQEEVRKATSGLVGIALGEFKELNQGIKINTRDFAVDTNQYVNYGAIRGQIQAQSNVTMKDSIAGEIREAVIEGMRNSRITVEVEGKADKDGIFKVVQTGAREYTMQTGEPAF